MPFVLTTVDSRALAEIETRATSPLNYSGRNRSLSINAPNQRNDHSCSSEPRQAPRKIDEKDASETRGSANLQIPATVVFECVIPAGLLVSHRSGYFEVENLSLQFTRTEIWKSTIPARATARSTWVESRSIPVIRSR